ncbi:Anamorsin homolog 2 [Coccomyxa sp. Obi]|nr:Anamorsin homolog 2 [Coccomyxa sp. Obi]
MKISTERALVLTDSPALTGSDLQNILKDCGLSLEAVTLMTASVNLTSAVLQQGAFSTVVSLARAANYHDVARLALLCTALRPGGILRVEEAKCADLNKNLLLAGFTDIAPCQMEAISQEGQSAFSARKPDWETGTSTALPRSSKLKAAAPAAPAQERLNRDVWKMAADEEEEELLDDEELLTEEDLKRPEVPAVGDCEIGASKKACADCTCGRAEAEAAGIKAQLTPDMLENPQSACGSCGMGDAFRCATCPYRGLPKFEMGQKIELPPDFLTADA